jgi:superfamily I DNA and RNA helicase
MSNFRGKSLRAIAQDISEGYVTVNPIFLKPFDDEGLKKLYQEIMKVQAEIRAEKFPYNDVQAIRWRNMRLQRLHTAAMILKNFARDRRVQLL